MVSPPTLLRHDYSMLPTPHCSILCCNTVAAAFAGCLYWCKCKLGMWRKNSEECIKASLSLHICLSLSFLMLFSFNFVRATNETTRRCCSVGVWHACWLYWLCTTHKIELKFESQNIFCILYFYTFYIEGQNFCIYVCVSASLVVFHSNKNFTGDQYASNLLNLIIHVSRSSPFYFTS